MAAHRLAKAARAPEWRAFRGLYTQSSKMTTGDTGEIERLMNVLESDAEECWPLYEEIGRLVVAYLLEHDRPAVSGIVEAWSASSRAHGALADTWPDSPRHAPIQAEACEADAALFARIRKAILPQAR